MRKLTLIFTMFSLSTIIFKASAQYSGSFTVQGDANKYYPVTFQDIEWFQNKATTLELGRSDVHTDGTWRGSLIAKFRYHTSQYGHRSNFIDADIYQFNNTFIGDWVDITSNNNSDAILIWLKGGGNTYYINAASNVYATVYDGVQNALPFQEVNGPARNYITALNPYINTNGSTSGGNAYYLGSANNFFLSNVGIGTTNPDKALTVNGTIRATEILVDSNVPHPDYVFDEDYDLATLKDVKTYINKNHHLPEIPSAAQVAKEGINLGEMNAKLLKKIEELTLYLIEKDIESETQKKTNTALYKQIGRLKQQVTTLSAIIKQKR